MVLITDPVGDMAARLRNGAMAGRKMVRMPTSRLKQAVAEVLKKEGFLAEWEREKEGVRADLVLTLAYAKKQPLLAQLRQISKPGRRVYMGASGVKAPLGGAGVAILSTSQGVMSDKEARKKRLGGEVLLEVW